MPGRFLKYPRTQPARAIIAGVAFFTTLRGILLLTPFYVPVAGLATTNLYGFGLEIGACLHIIVGVIGLVAAYTNNPKWLARGAFTLFGWYFFLTVAPLLLGGLTSFRWITPLTVAYVMAVFNIEQSWVHKRRVKVVVEGVLDE